MRWTKKLLLAALAATALFAALASTAGARNFSVSNSNIRSVFRPLEFISGENRISCTVTMEGTFHYRTIVKVANALIGYITRAIVDERNCRSEGPLGRNIRARVRNETLPWHVRYVSFTGRLPDVTIRIRLLRAGFNLEPVPIVGTCRYTATADGIIGGPRGGAITEEGGNATVTADEAIRFSSETFGCPQGFFRGRTPITLLGTETAIRVTLI